MIDPSQLSYAKTDEDGIWISRTAPSFSYSDGDEVEERIFKIVADANDRSSFSEEIRSGISDWPSLYHLSARRSGLIRPVLDLAQGDVLEIGAGCGAITRFLGESGKSVIALERSYRRAAIIARRCSDLPTVHVIADSFDRLQPLVLFDTILMIGVLEYARPLFHSDNPGDPCDAMLERARRFLRPGGRLIVAIENQLGLKYFAGHKEDHVGEAFFGIEDRYAPDGAVTFGRGELRSKLEATGFGKQQWWFPFPDHKLPLSIVSEKALEQGSGFDAGTLSSRSVISDPQRPDVTLFAMQRTWRLVERNGLLPDLANSFLVVASDEPIPDTRSLAFHFGAERRAGFAKIVRFELADSGLKAVKEAIGSPAALQKQGDVSVQLDDEPYVIGELWHDRFIQIVLRPAWSLTDLVTWARVWWNALLHVTGLDERKEALTLSSPLPGRYLDAIPRNMIVDEGRCMFIDLEWSVPSNIEAGYLLFRGLSDAFTSLDTCSEPDASVPRAIDEIIVELAFELGSWISRDDVTRYKDLEGQFQSRVAGSRGQPTSYQFGDMLLPIRPQLVSLSNVRSEMMSLQTELSRLREHKREVSDLETRYTDLAERNADLQARHAESQVRQADLEAKLQRAEAAASESARRLDAERVRLESIGGKLMALEQSTVWRASRPVRSLVGGHHNVRSGLKGLARSLFWVATPTRMPKRYRAIRGMSHHNGRSFWVNTRDILFGIKEIQAAALRPLESVYDTWVHQHDTLDESDRIAINQHLQALRYHPKISVIMPVYNTPEQVLADAIRSVLKQIYPNWELCIADDCSGEAHVATILSEFAKSDPRIKVVRRTRNGHIAAASNSALELASGEFIALLDHDDLLSEHALYEMTVELNAHPDADIIFSDEDKIDENGRRFDPYFKPDFSLDLLLGQNMVNHLGVYRKSLIDTIGGFRAGFEGSQDYDLLLRTIAQTTTAKIRHVPAILYHWRQTSAGQSFSQEYLDRCVGAAQRSVDQFLNAGSAQPVATIGRVSEQIPWNRVNWVVNNPEPMVSVIIPTRDRAELLKQCVTGLLQRTDYTRFEIIIVDNDSVEQGTLDLFQELQADPRVRVLRIGGPFNFSALNNAAAREARGDILLLLNNDIDVIEPHWLSEMIGIMRQADVGVVGAKLLYEDGRVQHAGVRLGAGTFDGGPGIAGHLGLFASRTDTGYFGSLALPRDVGAVTGACLAIRRSLYEQVGGLDEVNLKVAFNDIDLCLKVRSAGFRTVWTPFAELHHLESASRGSDIAPEKLDRFHAECSYMMERWRHELQNDPFYNPAFDSFESDYKLAIPPRRLKPWKMRQQW